MSPQKQETTALRTARTAKGWTILDVAKRAGLSWSVVRDIDAGAERGGFGSRLKISLAMKDASFKLWPSAERAELRRFKRMVKAIDE